MVRPTRKEQIDLATAVRETAWRQIALNGAASLSLRAIARELGITAPAIYNYFPRRDDLVTALIVDAFSDLGDAQFAALEGLPPNDHASRLAALGTAYRAWAVAHPQRYQLIFGTPIPGYHAPREVTQPVAARSLAALTGCLESARQDGKLDLSRAEGLEECLAEELADWRQAIKGSSPPVLFLALVIWSRVHGMVSLEIDHQYPDFIQSPGAVFSSQIRSMVDEYISP